MANALMVILVKLLWSVSLYVTLSIKNNARSHSLFCLERSGFHVFFTSPFHFKESQTDWLVHVLRGAGEIVPSLLCTLSPGLAYGCCPFPQDHFSLTPYSKCMSVYL